MRRNVRFQSLKTYLRLSALLSWSRVPASLPWHSGVDWCSFYFWYGDCSPRASWVHGVFPAGSWYVTGCYISYRWYSAYHRMAGCVYAFISMVEYCFCIDGVDRLVVIVRSFTLTISHRSSSFSSVSPLELLQLLCFNGIQKSLKLHLLEFTLVCPLQRYLLFTKQQWWCSFCVQRNN